MGTIDRVGKTTEEDVKPTRRRLLAGIGLIIAVGLAGCSDLRNQQFEATSVILPEADREAFGYAILADESTTFEREQAGVSVTITSHGAVYVPDFEDDN
ncbi:DUF6517 family protein [Halalkalirubrum salinum]|uniref:DUF6517 family protein n=1 Tax=Halalkalirubrum salinum TaxID=2563889 RepID=UPI0010FB1438|nr:DUF6517 family protein [Halalkalirubrum salinum]